ncbi:hypothetical protein TCAL_04959 [Tigriopus californicus]|uniref:Phosphatidic acid phosphatase type 2/haloperoxidase domain-containing protein n=1 Tax=Tigriopus californicus TaxID=6832 RepID=A0A553PDU3_TIGCA|nr:phospholipid phosphatase 1-like [Tigriopus californicus]TRY75849.1 hypothetical protein TCAL_04959 [Tigriopus californicus]
MAMTMGPYSLPILMTILSCLMAWIPPRSIGFYCNDPNVSHKYTTDTFPSSLLVFHMLIPILFIFQYCELGLLQAADPNRSNDDNSKLSWSRAWSLYGRYWVFTGVAFLTNETLKTFCPEARPHFLETCNPDWTKLDCTENANHYVTFDISWCQDQNTARNGAPKAIYDGMKSFPSGHAQMSCYASIFAILYLLERYPKNRRKLWRHFAVVVLIVAAFLASVTRITDRRHHWWDVAFGSSLGLIEGYISFFYMRKHILEFDAPMSEKAATIKS